MIQLSDDDIILIETAAAVITDRRRGFAPQRNWKATKEQDGYGAEGVFRRESGCAWRPRVYDDVYGDGGVDFTALDENGIPVTIDVKRSSRGYKEFWLAVPTVPVQLADIVVFVEIDTQFWRGESFGWARGRDVVGCKVRETWGGTPSWIVPGPLAPIYTLRITDVQQHIMPGRRLVDLDQHIGRPRREPA